MLGSLLKYEFVKLWKSIRYVLLAYTLLEIALLFMGRVMFWNTDIANLFRQESNYSKGVGVAFVIIIFLYFTLSSILAVFPYFHSVRRFGKDLSGKQAVLELMIPAPSWKKVIAKLITTICATIICSSISLVSFLIFIFIMTNSNKEIAEAISYIFKAIAQYPGKFIFGISQGFFMFASIYLLFFFCISISKWIAHKSKASVWISVGVFVLSIIAIVFLEEQADKFPIYSYEMLGINTSLSSILMDILIFATMFIGTSWIMEKKIEV